MYANCLDVDQTMNMNLEKAIILLIIGAFIVTSLNVLTAHRNPITKEDEAVEISKRADLVRDGVAKSSRFSFGATYYNSSWVEWMKKGHSKEMYLKVPKGHGIWKVVWTFLFYVGGYTVIAIVDAESGRIVHETLGVGFR